MCKRFFYLCLVWFGFASSGSLHAENRNLETTEINNSKNSLMETTLNLTQEWDKVFPQSDKVQHTKVTFRNRYGITLAADLYVPKNAAGKLSAIAVSGPFGAVKEQASGLYAQTLAERGFLALAFDPSFTGESGGEPRYVASPDINTEDFCAAVDYLCTRPDVDADRIGIIGICGWGGFALNAAAIDTRIKATVTSTMYDMSRVTANGYFDTMDADQRYELRKQLNAQRTEDYRNGTYALAGGVVDPLPEDAPQFVKDYYAYYKTSRGYHPRSLNSNWGWNVTSSLSFLNTPLLAYSQEIRSAVLMLHGEKAHSRYFSEDAFKKLKGKNKELLIIPGASHVDLYDNLQVIPFDKIVQFLQEYLPKEAEAIETDAKTAFQQEMVFPIGEPNTAYAQYFTGNSYLAFVSKDQVPVANVTFEPGCRNNWHIHRATKGGGQMLIGVAGRGWYQEEGKPAVEILPGTVINIPAGVKHWHGAASDSWFAHLAIEVPGENTSNEWLEPVSDEAYKHAQTSNHPQ